MANLVLKFPNNLKSFSVSASASSNGSPPGVHQSKGPVILELPLDRIRRPLMRTRANDPQKVKELMESISEIGLQVPIDVLEVDGEYYGMWAPCIFLNTNTLIVLLDNAMSLFLFHFELIIVLRFFGLSPL
ncbi:sulfiredoxin, chloroplastic mitochondrial [Olea europaea subsp. europaea]|uniref:sulfiredoxin n=1 Tax=Olea europaea subsp. europaea TaxID=158383 RepID=A0A8S0T186_OLEEU|nr:sulfiredoxin, chloroplastic mitochondrial [Olea europaea subsp. europaea]